MRRKSKRNAHSSHSSIEPLESRRLLANIHFVDAYFVDANGNKLTSVAVGNQPFIQIEFTTTGLAAGAHYDVTTATSGRTFTSTINWGAGLGGTGNWIFRSPQFLIRPGLQSLSASLDSNTDVVETDENDNSTPLFNFYTGVTFAPGFYKPLEGTQNFDWSVGNYNDTDANYPDDGFFGGVCEDFNGGDYCYDGHNGWDIGVANWREGYQGWDIYAAAGGTVSDMDDGNDDHNTEALGQPSNYVVIDHGGGWQTVYHHMAKNTITVATNQVITAAQAAAGFKIGEMGSSGNSTGLHLHWGVYYNGQLVEPMTDPANYLNFTLAYTPNAPAVLGSGTTNYDPSAEVGEGPSDVSIFQPGQTVTSWATLAGLETSDTFGTIWRRPDNTVAFNAAANNTGASHGGVWWHNFNLPANPQLGTWRVDWIINGIVERSAFFEVQNAGAAQARIYRTDTSPDEYIVDGRRSALHFGTIINSQTTAPSMTFTVYNSGQVPLTTSGLSIPSGFFLAGGSSLAASIPAGGSDSFTVFADVFATGHHEGYISFLTNDPSPGELVQSFKIDDDVMSASDAVNSLLSSAVDSVYIRRENGFANAQIWVNSNAVTPTWEIPITQMANFAINTLGGDDILTVDWRYGNPLNATGMDYNGSSGSDQLSIWGSPNNDAILLGNHQGWLGLAHVDLTSVEELLADGTDGDDTINVGGAGTEDLDQVGTNVTVYGSGGDDDLILNDQDDVNGGTYKINSSTFDRFAFGALTYFTFETFTLNSNNQSNSISVESSLQTTEIFVNGGTNNDFIYMTPTSTELQDIKSSVWVNGGGGNDTLVLSDEGHAAAETFTINSAAISSTRTGLTPPSFGVGYSNIEGAIIHSGTGGSTFNIHGTNAATPITINAGGGTDIFNVTPVSKNMNALDAALTLNGEAGTDSLIIDDSNFGPPGFTINSFSNTTFTTSHAAAVNYATLESLTYYNGNDGGLTTIESLPAGLLSLNFFGNDGVDSVIVGAAATGLAPLGVATINITGGAANDSITIHDEANAANDTYTITSTTFDKTGFGILNYSEEEDLSLTCSTGSNGIGLQSATIPMSIHGNDGGDSITLAAGNLSNIVSPITFTGDAGTDNILLRDSTYAFGSTTTVTPTTVTRAFFGGLTYSTSERLTLDAQNVASTIIVNGTAPNMFVTVDANDGTDTVNVNETDATSPVNITPSIGDDIITVNTDATGSAGAVFGASINLGSLTIGAGGRADIASGGTDKVLKTNGLTLTGSGILNIADHSAIVQATAATRLAVNTAVQNYIKSAHDGIPAWTGPGLTSASAAALPGSRAVGYMLNGAGGTTYATFDGVAVDLNSILVRFTTLGDLNLDKTTSISDFIDLGAHFNSSGGWREGDLNYDKQVTISDFIDLSSNFGQALSGDADPIAALPAAAESSEITALPDALDNTITSTSHRKAAGGRRTTRHPHHRRHHR